MIKYRKSIFTEREGLSAVSQTNRKLKMKHSRWPSGRVWGKDDICSCLDKQYGTTEFSVSTSWRLPGIRTVSFMVANMKGKGWASRSLQRRFRRVGDSLGPAGLTISLSWMVVTPFPCPSYLTHLTLAKIIAALFTLVAVLSVPCSAIIRAASYCSRWGPIP